MKGDINAVAMTIWGMVHGLVSLAIRDRFEKLVSRDQIMPMMQQSLNWMMNVLEAAAEKQ